MTGSAASKGVVVFLPDWRNGNPYQDYLARSVEAASGCEVRFENIPRVRFPLQTVLARNPGTRVLHLHWIPPYVHRIYWYKNRFRARYMLGTLIADILMARLRGVSVVWTAHNFISHEAQSAHRERIARRWLSRVVSRVIFHSEEARAFATLGWGLKRMPRRSTVIPHGNYMDMYAPDDARRDAIRQELGFGPGTRTILFFGAIRRYKGLDELVAAFKLTDDPNLRLVIAGGAQNTDTEDWAKELATLDPRIVTRIGFVPDEDVAPLFALADLVVIPFRRTLTSGSAILALSLGAPLALPVHARVLGLPETPGVQYFEDVEHLAYIMRKLGGMNRLESYESNRAVAARLDWRSIGAETVRAYGLRGQADARGVPQTDPAE